MSDYIKREYKLPNGGAVTADFNELGIATITIQAMDALFDILNSSDVVEVVRCKDCRWYERDIFDREAGVCFNPNKCTKTLGFEVLNEDYCSYGERADT